VDLAGGFEEHSGKNLVGQDLFIDYCHPNETGHKLIARIVLRDMVRILETRGIDGGAVSERIREDGSAAPYYSGPNMLYAQGMTHENNGDLAGAERYYRQTLVSKPDYPEALGNLAYLRYRLGDRKEAGELAMKSLEKDPGLSTPLMLMGMFSLQDGNLPEARDYAKRLLRNDPDQPYALEIMGDISAAEKDWPSALTFYTRARSAGGDHELLRRKIAGAEGALRERSRP
jgi:tetratricopeptide (TPR) repeat protein